MSSKKWDVKIQDFQSIKSIDISIENGLNIITGKSNNGKTAIFRAIEAALWNSGTDDMVRAGAKIAGVFINNGEHSMKYCRNAVGKNEKTAYQFDGGSVQRKVGRNQLPEVAQLFGVRDVRMQNGVKVKLNFWSQNDSPFLMDKTSGQLYEFLSLSSAEKYFKVLKSMAADIKVQEAEINNASIAIDTLKSLNNEKKDFLKKNEGFDVLYQKVLQSGEEANKFNNNISKIGNILKIKSSVKETNEKLESVSNAINSIPIQDFTEKYNKIITLSSEYEKIKSIIANIINVSSSIKGLQDRLKSCDNALSSSSSVLNETEPKLNKLNKESEELSLFESKLNSCNKLQNDIQIISEKLSELNKNGQINLGEISTKIDDLSRESQSIKDTISMVNAVVSTQKSIKSLTEDKLNPVSTKLEEATVQFNNFKKEIGHCPFCGSVLENHEHGVK